MKWKKVLIPLAVILVLAAVAVAVYAVLNPVDTTLEFTARDAVSGKWIYDSSFRLQGRLIRSHFQSDQGPVAQRFTHLKPGAAVLELSAPHYQSVTREVALKRGRNRLEEPIAMVGLEIPQLRDFIMFEDRDSGDIVVEIRPVSKAGPAVVNHPCLDLWIGARVTVQMKNGLPVQAETEEGSVRGEELFRGRLEWQFDAYPETVFRYGTRIPGSKMKPSADPFWAVDYLIVVPNPPNVTREELESIMQKTWSLEPEAVAKYLAPFEQQNKFKAYVFTSWNVPGGKE